MSLIFSAKEMLEDQKLQPNKAVIQPDGRTLIVDSVKLAVNCPSNTSQTEANCSIKVCYSDILFIFAYFAHSKALLSEL